jgi:hypothetical protein
MFPLGVLAEWPGAMPCGCQQCCGQCCGPEAVGCFNCCCRGSYKFPVPPQYTYFWPGIYSQKTMTAGVSPWRYPPLLLMEDAGSANGELSKQQSPARSARASAAAKVAAGRKAASQVEKTAHRDAREKSGK